ncbi:RNA polymerase sigma factor [Gimesia aquarii]|uniref:RNA polymerase sigma factor n=1 Tax=Gimesia aquarii TaxID=2527964 RepID=A0A517X2G4_9PLAN|nr:RNA polymerase sigma factor [Gimesia aquarii]QDU11700.1 ECF RNA polymerase sigma factor SigW [Gimesia aquarii]
MNEEDAAQVRSCLEGNKDAMRAFVARFQSSIFGLCYRMLGHRHDAEDVAQEVFVRAFRSLHQWDSARTLKPWLLTIAANRCRTFLSKRSKRPIPTEFAPELAVSQSPEPLQDLGEELQNAINLLREDHRTCFILFHQEQMSCQEIGEVLDRPEGTIKTWLHRSRQELSSTLRQRGIVPEVRHESR